VPILLNNGLVVFGNQTETESSENDSQNTTSFQEAVAEKPPQKIFYLSGKISTSLGTTSSEMPQSMKPLRFSIALSGRNSPKWRVR
jgi:hypothetical protein